MVCVGRVGGLNLSVLVALVARARGHPTTPDPRTRHASARGRSPGRRRCAVVRRDPVASAALPQPRAAASVAASPMPVECPTVASAPRASSRSSCTRRRRAEHRALHGEARRQPVAHRGGAPGRRHPVRRTRRPQLGRPERAAGLPATRDRPAGTRRRHDRRRSVRRPARRHAVRDRRGRTRRCQCLPRDLRGLAPHGAVERQAPPRSGPHPSGLEVTLPGHRHRSPRRTGECAAAEVHRRQIRPVETEPPASREPTGADG